MNEFVQGVLGTVVVLGGLCGFIYWVFGVMEKRLEIKMDYVLNEVNSIATELREERRSKDALYKFVLDNYKK